MGLHPARRSRRTVAAVTLLAIAATGCGGTPGDESTSTSALRPTPTTTTTAATTTSEPIGRGEDATGHASPLDELPSSAGDVPTTTAPPAPTTTTVPHAGAPRDFVELGYVPVSGDLAVRLDDRAARSSLAELLQREDVEHLAAARAALSEPPAPGETGFAFVLLGCAETSAELALDASTIEATLTGNERVVCVVPSAFLAVFTVPAEDVAPGARLVGAAPPGA